MLFALLAIPLVLAACFARVFASRARLIETG
jgi:hypothetical protein